MCVMTKTNSLLQKINECTVCQEYLPHGVRPVLQFNPKARILIAGQAPGRKVHESGIPFNDASGDRLREWMGVTKDVFYDPAQVAILPMGFCYPGTGENGDLPPRPECERIWHKQLLAQLSDLEVTIVLGKYAQSYYFGNNKLTLTELVKSWASYWPEKIPLPHPSPRNNIWLSKNPWFEKEVLPLLQKRVLSIIK